MAPSIRPSYRPIVRSTLNESCAAEVNSLRPGAKPCEEGECTKGLSKSTVSFHNFWHMMALADGEDVKYEASLVCAETQSMLASKAGLHFLGLC